MRHPLGFTAITLTAFGRRLRLHIWRPGGSTAPHDHKADYASLVLLGRFTEILWRVQPGTAHHAHRVIHDGPGRRYQATGAAALLLPATAVVHRAGRRYRREAWQVHTFGPVGAGPHVTLVLQGRRQRESTVWFDNVREGS